MSKAERKSWSQETVSLQLPRIEAKANAFMTTEKRMMLLIAAKTALAAGICYSVARLAGLQDGYWGAISAIIVLQSNVGSTVTASRDRLIGTLIGAAFGAAFSLLGQGLWPYLLAVVAAMLTCSLLGLKNSSRLAGVTVTILMLVHRSGSNWTLPLHRVLEVLLGIIVALGISALVLPNRARTRLRDGLAQEYLLKGALFAAVVEGFRGNASVDLPRRWEDVEAINEENGQLLQAARNEPSGGPASLESLSLVHQFGREMKDLLHALDLAVQGSGGKEYAAHLEPELGRLVLDINRGFNWLAECIHRWRFDTPPPALSLEEDITALEAKMAALRPTGLALSQAEILRAYAVVLHLTQLARVLRASRVETNKTVE